MKRPLLILLSAVAAVFMLAGVASAEVWWTTFPKTHYAFSLASEGCAGCHVTHTASAAKLLKTGTTQTGFCYSCHASVTYSPYDVDTGTIRGNDGNNRPSRAGKFAYLSGSVTSRHDVGSPTVDSTAMAWNQIPGNGDNLGGFTNGFKCGSCHDVHAGDAPSSDRLLKVRVWSHQQPIYVAQFAYNTTTLEVTKYGNDQGTSDAINAYCGLCHNRFNLGDNAAKTVVNSAYQTVSGVTYYRHALGIPISQGTSPALTVYLGNYDTTSGAGKNVVLCLTCHYAHGTTAVANTDYPNWKRDPDSTLGNGSGSALLRLDKRGVCFDCHGAATKNLEAFGQTNT